MSAVTPLAAKDALGPAPTRALTTSQSLRFASGALGMSVVPSFLASWQMYYFAPPADSGRKAYMSAAAIGIINLVGQIAHSAADGVIGYASDRTRTRWGRRIPWIALSAPICAASFIALWWPPAAGAGWVYAVWLAGVRAVMWIAYTAAVGPYCSLLPEVTDASDEKGRLRVAVYMAVFEVIGSVLATAGAGWMIESMRTGASFGPVVFSDGYKLAAAIAGAISLAGFILAISAVRERPHDKSKEVPFGLLRSLLETLKNPAFRPYVLSFVAFRIALLATLTMLPYQVSAILGLADAEGVAGTLQVIIILGAVLLFPLVEWLARRVGKKRVMSWGFVGFGVVMSVSALVGKLPFGGPMAQAFAVYALATFPVATLFVLVRPILVDVIEQDAERTGFRREGMYNGVEGMLTKLAEGIGPVLAAGLFSWFGATRAQPWGVVLLGPIAGMLCFVGWAFFRAYPIEK